jgi:hypothetical protein
MENTTLFSSSPVPSLSQIGYESRELSSKHRDQAALAAVVAPSGASSLRLSAAAVRACYRALVLRGMGLARRVHLSAEVGGSRTRFRKVTREDGLKEGAEDDLSTTITCEHFEINCNFSVDLPSLGKSHPEDKDKLEGVVEGCVC